MIKQSLLRLAQLVEVLTGIGFGVIFGLALLRVPHLLGDTFVWVEIGLMLSSGTMIAICAYLYRKSSRMLRSMKPD
jgi:hypothetical protein